MVWRPASLSQRGFTRNENSKSPEGEHVNNHAMYRLPDNPVSSSEGRA
jgi:hypothetical protein